MFDFHMHSDVSFDGRASAKVMAQEAARQGLQEICFTDHIDYLPNTQVQEMVFDTRVYAAAYDNLHIPGLIIRKGVEMGLTPHNQQQVRSDLQRRNFDFVLGSIHLVGGMDIYLAPYWQGKTVAKAEQEFLEETLACVQVHEDYDVLAHLTYISKTGAHIAPRPVSYEDNRRIMDEILRILVQREKGLELNTSGMDKVGVFLPDADYFLRFRQLGGRIVTVGSDAHDAKRVGQYSRQACAMLKDIFGYVCTFAQRKPIFHEL